MSLTGKATLAEYGKEMKLAAQDISGRNLKERFKHGVHLCKNGCKERWNKTERNLPRID